MKFIRTFAICILLFSNSYAQNRLEITVKDADSGEALVGASVFIQSLNAGGSTNPDGYLKLENLPDGTLSIKINYLGYENQTVKVSLPSQTALTILMEHDHDEMEEVVISSTRSSRTIQNIPTRVEFIGGEELQEKVNMKPGDIRMVLNESTGIITQITSAMSGNASIRIQGLDGRYTQILKDGLPLFSGAAAGLGLLQIPPLDLKQVEVIKGSTSTLYGGGAIAGMVNLISRTPEEEASLELLLNATSGGGLDVSAFYGKMGDKIGITTYAAFNQNTAYDPSDLGLSAIPEFQRFTLNPRLFFNPSASTKMNFGINSSIEERIGGDMAYLNDRENNTGYFESNNSTRLSSQFGMNHRFTDNKQLEIKNSLNHFDRELSTPAYVFDGTQFSTFSEINYSIEQNESEWIVGVNLWTEKFRQEPFSNQQIKDYGFNTLGIFGQNVWETSELLTIETGLRADYVTDYGWLLLPRLSALFQVHPKLTSRLGGGLGYKAPTLFTEDTERRQYRDILPLNSNFNKLERSYGANWDINYTTLIGTKLTLNINQLFYYTYLSDPLMLKAVDNSLFQLQNIDDYINTKGLETNMKFGYDDFKLFLGYTFTDTKLTENDITSENPLTPKHRINSVLMYEKHDEIRIGLEGYYYSTQQLGDGKSGRDYWLMGIMVEKMWEGFSVFINFENILDARQTRFDTIYTGSIGNPQFRDIYAPLEGFVVNGGFKIKLH